MVNRHRAYWSSMSNSKYDFAPEQLDKDIQANKERYERKKEHVRALIEGTFKSDPVRADETFNIFIAVLREIREKQ